MILNVYIKIINVSSLLHRYWFLISFMTRDVFHWLHWWFINVFNMLPTGFRTLWCWSSINHIHFAHHPIWEKMQLSQSYCENFCKMLRENALSLTTSCKIRLNLIEFSQKRHTTLEEHFAIYIEFVRILFHLHFFFRQIKPLQNIWFQETPYPWCF